MKLRVLKKNDGTFEPQYWDEESKFPHWAECHLTNNLVSRHYHNEEDAKDVCLAFYEKWKSERGEVVWMKDMDQDIIWPDWKDKK